jgi:hypothetical protein
MGRPRTTTTREHEHHQPERVSDRVGGVHVAEECREVGDSIGGWGVGTAAAVLWRPWRVAAHQAGNGTDPTAMEA